MSASEALLEWRDYSYFAYELEFARLEVERVFNTRPKTDERGLRVEGRAFCAGAVERLTYFARVQTPDGGVLIPRQARLEATANGSRGERQSTRYSAHGLHEYKGKFNPQVVRAIGNMLGLPLGATVADPFAGSGTTLLECAHAGWSAEGFDINPLAVQIANAKLRALRIGNGRLLELAQTVTREIEPFAWLATDGKLPRRELDRALGHGWVNELPSPEYLLAWFPEPVLAQAVVVLRAIQSVVPEHEDKQIFYVLLSDELRSCSFQDPGDLRIRRRKDPQPNYPLLTALAEGIDKKLTRVAKARAEIGDILGYQRAFRHDVTTGLPCGTGLGQWDAIITSPPYASALPYIDTQRLSLVLLGHVHPKDIRSTEAQLIGARDLTKRERLAEEAFITGGHPAIPEDVLEFCRALLAASRRPGNGFRRQNMPALILRYLRQMSAFFDAARDGLKPGAPAALVVGRNRTELGGKEFVIDTPDLLRRVAEHRGFTFLEARDMDTYARFDVHQQNSIDSEQLIVLRAPG